MASEQNVRENVAWVRGFLTGAIAVCVVMIVVGLWVTP